MSQSVKERLATPTKAALGPSQKTLRNPRPKTASARSEKGVKAKQTTQALLDEIELLTSYASDTVYRLRYDTMTYDYISPNVTKLLGFSAEEMQKMNFRSLIVETKIVTDGLKQVNSFEELEARRTAGDVSKWQADYLMRTKDGRKLWVSDVSHPWFDARGNIIGSVGSLRNITERVEAELKNREQMQKLADTDSLTGVSNRRHFFNELEKELRRINRSESDVSMLLVNVDGHSKYVAEYGEDIGDALLLSVTSIIKNALRGSDLPARLGGEEFGVILPDTPSGGACQVAERIRDAVLKCDFTTGSDKSPLHISVSIGVATSSFGEHLDASDMFKLADTRMYISQNSGGNQVSLDQLRQTH